uniref:Fucosyltransferase n=1 Tax=Octactis speculum TaxID=3111310 RepID=A0A7S2DJ44_9STRA
MDDHDGQQQQYSRCDNKLTLPAPPAAKLLVFSVFFHIAIENVSQKDYFTEKLIDCLLTRTVPVYWGCPNICDYFDVSGIIVIEDESDDDDPDGGAVVSDNIVRVLKSLTPEDYFRRQEAIDRNYFLACKWINQNARMEHAIRCSLNDQ